MEITKIKPIPFIKSDVARLGTMAYVLEKNQNAGFAGFVSALGAEEVTLTGIRSGKGATVKLTAEKLAAKDYAELRFAQDMASIETQNMAPWTEDIDTKVIDDDICKPSYFVMYRKSAEESYTNGLIVTVERGKMTVSTVIGGKNTVVTVTLAEIEREGFAAEVYPTLASGSGENSGTVTYLGEGK